MAEQILGEKVRERLQNLRATLLDADPRVYEFADYLRSDYIWPMVEPNDFVHSSFLALGDLQTGNDRRVNRTQRPPSGLIGCPPQTYVGLAMYIPQIAEVIFPEDFAQEVRTAFQSGKYKLPY